jgi:hypothetical protein
MYKRFAGGKCVGVSVSLALTDTKCASHDTFDTTCCVTVSHRYERTLGRA